MSQLTAIPIAGERPISLRCSKDGVLLVQVAGAADTARLSAPSDVPPPVPPPPNPILGIAPNGDLTALACDEHGRLMVCDDESRRQFRDSVKRFKTAGVAAPPRFHNVALAGEVRTVLLRPNENTLALVGPAVLVHLSVRNNTRALAVFKLRWRTATDGGEMVTAPGGIDRELAAGEAFELPLQAGVAVPSVLDAMAATEATASEGKNGCSLLLHFVRT